MSSGERLGFFFSLRVVDFPQEKRALKMEDEKKAGRPKKEINYALVADLGSIMCTSEEASAILGVSKAVFDHDEKAQEVFRNAKQTGKMSLRRTQFRLAQENVTMAIWLGKQYLNQADKQEISADQAVTIISDVKKEDN